MTNHTHSIQTIRDYVLGRLSEAETERLDELSITDDECAERIRAVEHDLADAYARGELHGSDLEQFRSRYLTAPGRHAAVRFAEALQSLDENDRNPGRVGSPHAAWVSARIRERVPASGWALTAAVVLLATASAWLAFDNRTLRARATHAESARDELQRDRQLRDAEARRAAETAPPSPSPGPPPQTVATLLLAPQLRSARQLPAVVLAVGAGDLAVQLDLEPVDYPAYEASLVASTGDRIVWRSDRLIARTIGDRKRIDLGLPASVLSPQEYMIRVSGVPARGASEIVGEYRFIVVR